MQEVTAPGWELRTINNGFGLAVRVFIFYLFAVLITLFIWSARLWWRLRLTSSRTWRVLDDALEHLDKGNFSALPATAQEISRQSPEGGLRAWAALPAGSDAAGFLRVLRVAETEFFFAWRKLRGTTMTLKSTLGLTLLLAGLLFAFETHKILHVIQAEKATGLRAIAGGLAENLVTFELGIIVSVLLYVAYIYFEGRLARREARWDYFCARVKERLSAN